MPPNIRTLLAAFFRANPSLMAIEFTYAGRRNDGQLTDISARGKSGLPVDLDDLTSPTKAQPEEALYDPLFTLLHALVPMWCLGLGSKGSGTVTRDLQIRLVHTERRVEAVTREIEA